MSSGSIASFFPSSEPVPTELLFSLAQVVYAASCVNFFLFAFLVFHAHLYLREEGWKKDNWFFRGIVSNLVLLSICSIGLSSAAAHWVLKSLYLGEYLADQLNWIDVVQRLLCFPTGFLANAFFTWRIFQISDSRAVWISCLLLWIPTATGFMLAECFHIVTMTNFQYRRTWRICELIGTSGIFALDVFYFTVLSYRLYICRRRQFKPDHDPVSVYFLSTVKVSFFTCAVTIGNLVTVAFLDSPRVSIYYSFFLLILPNAWSLSVVWAINQRVTVRRKMRSSISDDASLAQRLEVVGWRNNVAMNQSRKAVEEDPERFDPSRWRGDDENVSKKNHRRTRTVSHKHKEPDYASFELDTSPLDALEVPPIETRASGIWVKTETKVASSLA
ncbi:uncharacterized protein JCM6883_006373 [Sporobolomyces salmoneus]|uniref:uncharacterized protein n=1 Tax=Sporobolomyces salmoneus TaxID=183962 RepID=UPI003170B196